MFEAGVDMYRMLVVDIDGTLVDPDKRIPDANLRAIRQLQEAGYSFTLATGRMEESTQPFAERLGVTLPVILYNGARIADLRTGSTLYEERLPHQILVGAARLARGKALTASLYWQGRLYVAEIDGDIREYAAKHRVTPHAVGDLVRFLLDNPAVAAYKLVYTGDGARIAAFREELESLCSSDRAVLTESFPGVLEILPGGVSKGAALTRLAAHLGIDLAEVVAIGDAPNDLEMLATAGLGVAVADAYPEVQKAARWITGAGGEGGVARVIDRFFLRYRPAAHLPAARAASA